MSILQKKAASLLPHMIGLLVLTVMPFYAFAAEGGLAGVIQTINNLINIVIPVIISLAMVYFLYGVSKYILRSNDPNAQSEGIQMMIHGIIGLFVMVSVWGLVNLLVNTFDLQTNIEPRAPGLPTFQ